MVKKFIPNHRSKRLQASTEQYAASKGKQAAQEMVLTIVPPLFALVEAMGHFFVLLDTHHDPNWIKVLKKRRDLLEDCFHNFEEAVTSAVVQHIGNDEAYVKQIVGELVPHMSDLQDAIKAAIGDGENGDQGAALNELSPRFPGLQTLWSDVQSTLGLLQETRLQRHTVHMGQRLIDLEPFYGDNIRRAWKHVYNDLKFKGYKKLDDDERATWDWLMDENPNGKEKYQLDDFETRLRTIKMRVKDAKQREGDN